MEVSICSFVFALMVSNDVVDDGASLLRRYLFTRDLKTHIVPTHQETPTQMAMFLVQESESRDIASQGLLDEMPEGCSGAGFCLEKHHDYPQDTIDDLLSKKYHIQLGNIHEDKPVDRQGVYDEGQYDCDKKITYGEIFEILDANDKIRIVVQSSKQFKQQIRIEQCVNPGRLLTAGGTDHFSTEELKDNLIYCVEKKLEYSFLVLTRDGKGIEAVRSKHGIPVCCSCKYEQSYE